MGGLDRWKKEIRGLGRFGSRRGKTEGLGCLALVVEEEMVETPVFARGRGAIPCFVKVDNLVELT